VIKKWEQTRQIGKHSKARKITFISNRQLLVRLQSSFGSSLKHIFWISTRIKKKRFYNKAQWWKVSFKTHKIVKKYSRYLRKTSKRSFQRSLKFSKVHSQGNFEQNLLIRHDNANINLPSSEIQVNSPVCRRRFSEGSRETRWKFIDT
jgi:hypothetical protein